MIRDFKIINDNKHSSEFVATDGTLYVNISAFSPNMGEDDVLFHIIRAIHCETICFYNVKSGGKTKCDPLCYPNELAIRITAEIVKFLPKHLFYDEY